MQQSANRIAALMKSHLYGIATLPGMTDYVMVDGKTTGDFGSPPLQPQAQPGAAQLQSQSQLAPAQPQPHPQHSKRRGPHVPDKKPPSSVTVFHDPLSFAAIFEEPDSPTRSFYGKYLDGWHLIGAPDPAAPFTPSMGTAAPANSMRPASGDDDPRRFLGQVLQSAQGRAHRLEALLYAQMFVPYIQAVPPMESPSNAEPGAASRKQTLRGSPSKGEYVPRSAVSADSVIAQSVLGPSSHGGAHPHHHIHKSGVVRPPPINTAAVWGSDNVKPRAKVRKPKTLPRDTPQFPHVPSP